MEKESKKRSATRAALRLDLQAAFKSADLLYTSLSRRPRRITEEQVKEIVFRHREQLREMKTTYSAATRQRNPSTKFRQFAIRLNPSFTRFVNRNAKIDVKRLPLLHSGLLSDRSIYLLAGLLGCDQRISDEISVEMPEVFQEFEYDKKGLRCTSWNRFFHRASIPLRPTDNEQLEKLREEYEILVEAAPPSRKKRKREGNQKDSSTDDSCSSESSNSPVQPLH